MKQIEVGIEIGENGISFIGIEEVNALIAHGGRVTSVEAGEALVDEEDSDDGSECFSLAGCILKINIQI